MLPKSISIIISTYNNPEWLEKTLWGYQNQTYTDFDILIADDGSKEPTAALIKQFKDKTDLRITHVWHPDNGFQKCEILNRAIAASKAEYLIFTDQDCIPRKDFVAQHKKYAQRGYFLSGGYFKLPMSISKKIDREDVASGKTFNLKWLKNNGLKCSFKATKLWRSRVYASILNAITPAKASWNGCNSSCWRKDAVIVNGFNTDMHYGGEDREFGERLANAGLKSKQLRYTVIALHLDHDRPYKNEAQMNRNRTIREQVKESKIVCTPHGIQNYNEL